MWYLLLKYVLRNMIEVLFGAFLPVDQFEGMVKEEAKYMKSYRQQMLSVN